MKDYPSILGSTNCPNKPCVAFDKPDGSNLRWEWGRKKGFWKHGTRTRLFDASDSIFGQAIDIFSQKFSKDLEKIFLKEFSKYSKIIPFTEYLGPNSFAGVHVPGDKTDLILIDLWLDRYGLIGPKNFIKYFGHLDIPRIIYTGNLTKEFIDNVRKGCYNVFEGVVCKGGSGKDHWMRKIKTDAYREALKQRYSDWTKFWE